MDFIKRNKETIIIGVIIGVSVAIITYFFVRPSFYYFFPNKPITSEKGNSHIEDNSGSSIIKAKIETSEITTLEEAKKKAQEQEDTRIKKFMAQEELCREEEILTKAEQLFNSGKTNSLEEAKKVVRQQKDTEIKEYWEQSVIRREEEMSKEAEQLYKSGKTNSLDEAKKIVKEQKDAEIKKYWEQLELNREKILLNNTKQILK